MGEAASEIAILKSRGSASDARLAAAHEQMRSAEEDAAEWKRKYDIAVRETKAALEKVAASSFEKDFQEMLQQLKFEKEKTEVLLKEKDEMLKAKDDEIEMKGKEHEKKKSEFQKLQIERLAQIERAQRHVESLYSDWDLFPPKTIKDPEAKKPEDWDYKEYIPDPEDKKPEGYEDIPKEIPNPAAKKPEDWDDEEDGEWTAPTISNTDASSKMTMKQMWFWMLLTLFTLVGEWHGRCYAFLEEERIGLLEIKSSIDPNGFTLRDWVDTSNESISNCCEWWGVECDNTTRRVIQLTLSNVRDYSLGDLVLNASLFLPFKELRSLDLSVNAIAGCHENQGLCC
ncbi:hypothetical protein DKX38_006877 [Salix brachista]|uniref:Leucine-rich repeat-containing N-terminal plant-type domain-containing protein n=1 Tax=Salix brachista TaxID=2182728 RepID=A0A5N5MM01_9ROSI|nr:hypothetical protein DKX38_006877 [Salix brachista]